jgi:hypothetical protein
MERHLLINVSNTSPTRITPTGTHSGIDLTMQNVNGSGYIYVGGAGVTAENYGYRIYPNHAFSIELNGNEAIYAIASAPNMKVATLRTRLESGS